jgi:hypothetical protein
VEATPPGPRCVLLVRHAVDPGFPGQGRQEVGGTVLVGNPVGSLACVIAASGPNPLMSVVHCHR